MRDTLISSKFPYRFLALQPFTARGYHVVMFAHEMRISKADSQAFFVGDKDEQTKLFFLRRRFSRERTPMIQICSGNSTCDTRTPELPGSRKAVWFAPPQSRPGLHFVHYGEGARVSAFELWF